MQPADNKTVLITGATGGLGKKVAEDLASLDMELLLHGRSPEKAKAAVREISDAAGNRNIKYYSADFSSLEDVRSLAEKVLEENSRLEVLINNAGIGPGPAGAAREFSRDGHELRFAVNYLSAFVLTRILLPLLRRSATARVVNVASAGQQAIDFKDVMLSAGYDGLRAYCQSKLAMVMFTIDLAEELEETGITVNCLHPATLMPTAMVKETDYFTGSVDAVEQGADAVKYLALAEELNRVTGQYFNGKKPGRANAQAYDIDARRRLKELSLELAGL
ncbi:MAG: SDR family NAD(P)-dependent oxidoreductase [Desulfosalsimonas sp.]